MATDANGISYLYVANSAYLGDRGDYQGHLTAINLADGSQKVFNGLCSAQHVHFVEKPSSPDCHEVQAGIWARAGVAYDPAINRIFMVTGNGPFDPKRFCWGDTILALNPDGTGASGGPLDSYTPADYGRLDRADLDPGSTAPAFLPIHSGLSDAFRNLAVQGGKDGKLRLINLENLSGKGGPGNTHGELSGGVTLGEQILTAPAVWVAPSDNSTWLFVANRAGVSGLKLAVDQEGNPRLSPIWKKYHGGNSPIVANGILFYAGSRNIRALNPSNGEQLWHDTQIGAIHWESPIVADGRLYITDEGGNLTVYSSGGNVGKD